MASLETCPSVPVYACIVAEPKISINKYILTSDEINMEHSTQYYT